MNKIFLIIFGAMLIVCIMAALFFLKKGVRTDKAIELAKASAEFKKTKPGSEGFINKRRHIANKLIPHLKIGMTTKEVESLLGEPDKISSDGSYSYWNYGLWYSQFISIWFDANGKLIKMNACASPQSDERANPTGVYTLEPNSN